ncbi:hypothetical protein FRC12_005975 [Ceratobasidium sp. 428]|nr:hypothetical protein FRC12_005975 [Ceratobasidium sp. 428]
MTTKFDAENAENLLEIEQQFAVKAVEHAQTYWNLIEAVPPSRLKLTKLDEEIYNDFIEQFPEYNADHSTIQVINEDVLKSKENKPRWNKFMNSYEKKVYEHNFGALLRKDANGEYDEQNTVFGKLPRVSSCIGCSYRSSTEDAVLCI